MRCGGPPRMLLAPQTRITKQTHASTAAVRWATRPLLACHAPSRRRCKPGGLAASGSWLHVPCSRVAERRGSVKGCTHCAQLAASRAARTTRGQLAAVSLAKAAGLAKDARYHRRRDRHAAPLTTGSLRRLAWCGRRPHTDRHACWLQVRWLCPRCRPRPTPSPRQAGLAGPGAGQGKKLPKNCWRPRICVGIMMAGACAWIGGHPGRLSLAATGLPRTEVPPVADPLEFTLYCLTWPCSASPPPSRRPGRSGADARDSAAPRLRTWEAGARGTGLGGGGSRRRGCHDRGTASPLHGALVGLGLVSFDAAGSRACTLSSGVGLACAHPHHHALPAKPPPQPPTPPLSLAPGVHFSEQAVFKVRLEALARGEPGELDADFLAHAAR